MNELEKKFAEAALEKVINEILACAQKDELIDQIIIHANTDPEFVKFIKLTTLALDLMEILEEDEKK